MNNIKLLDCTLRDGGYYTDWDFDKNLVIDYCRAMEELPIDYVEVGYRSIPLNGYLGEYFYCPDYVLKELKGLMPSKKLAVILNEKDIRAEHVTEILTSCLPYIALIRIAVDPKNFERAIILAEAVKKLGFEVAFNVMYMSSWKEDTSFLNLLEGTEETIDYFYMVDSFGGVLPNDVKDIINLVKPKTNIPLGFHGHNNLEMALANTLTSIDEGCAIVDATITGMGRGAGNLKTELLLTYLSSHKNLDVSFDSLSTCVADFENLKKRHNWGTSLPYMVSGANSLPQKEVMDWVSNISFSLNSIVRALNNQKDNVSDNVKLPVFEVSESYNRVVIIGGGVGAVKHSKAVVEYINNNIEDVCLIHSSSKNAIHYKEIDVLQYFCLVGNEGHRLNKVYNGSPDSKVYKCILPPYPRKMGTFIPRAVEDRAYELCSVNFTNKHKDSLFTLALETALQLKCTEIYLVGFDGYQEGMGNKERGLAKENEYLIKKILDLSVKISAITPTVYEEPQTSVYKLLI